MYGTKRFDQVAKWDVACLNFARTQVKAFGIMFRCAVPLSVSWDQSGATRWLALRPDSQDLGKAKSVLLPFSVRICIGIETTAQSSCTGCLESFPKEEQPRKGLHVLMNGIFGSREISFAIFNSKNHSSNPLAMMSRKRRLFRMLVC